MTSSGVMPSDTARSAISRVFLLAIPGLRPDPGLAPPRPAISKAYERVQLKKINAGRFPGLDTFNAPALHKVHGNHANLKGTDHDLLFRIPRPQQPNHLWLRNRARREPL